MTGAPGLSRREVILGAGAAALGAAAGAAAVAASGGSSRGGASTHENAPDLPDSAPGPSGAALIVQAGPAAPAPAFPVTMAMAEAAPGLDTRVWLWRDGGIQDFALPGTGASVDGLCVSPDGAYVAWLGYSAELQSGALYVARLAADAPAHLLTDGGRQGRAPFWLGERRLAYADTDGEAAVWRADRSDHDHETPVDLRAAYVADGTRMAYIEEGRLVVLTAKGEPVRRVAGPLTRGTVVTSLSDRGRYAVVGADRPGGVAPRHGDRIVDTTTGAEAAMPVDAAVAEAAYAGSILVVHRIKDGDPIFEAHAPGRDPVVVRHGELNGSGWIWM